MSNINTSFEHVLHNLQERSDIISKGKELMDDLLILLKDKNAENKLYQILTRTVDTRILSIYKNYMESMDRFNIGVVPFVADYYAIIDKHIDQFHFKYIYNYSSHQEHYNPILTEYNSKCKFNLLDLVDIFTNQCYNLKYFKIYSDVTLVRRSHEQTWAIYQNLSKFISMESVYDLSDLFIHEFNVLVESIKQHGSLQKDGSKLLLTDNDLSKINEIKSLIQQFNNIKLDFKPSEEIIDYCECGNIMQVMPESSELVCDNCGYLYELKGTVFNDCQFYSQESIRYKHAGYEPSKHVKSWLERIQAKETNTITDDQLIKIEACIKRDGITNKKRLTIEQLRRYLKDSGLTELNEHVALIKRLITGIAPPQLTYAETQDITNSFSKAVKAYNVIRPSNKSNMLFYPYIVWKLVEMHIPDFYKRKNLLSFIHLQGAQTLIQNDTIWAQICKITRGFKYKPTDRYAYLD